jgi:hypothetical protein
MRVGIRGAAFAALVILGVAAQPAVAMTPPTKADCNVSNAAATTVPDGRPVKPAVKLQPEPNSQSRIINFGDDRDEEFQRYTLTAEPALRPGDEKRLSLVADVMTRTGSDTAETVTFPDPTFTPIVVYGNRKRLTFGVCLKPPHGLPAGKYTGLITTDGPPGIEDTSVTVTANAKNGSWFKYGVALTLLIAFGVLLYKAAADTRAKRIEAAKDGNDAARKAAGEWWPAARLQLGDLAWLASTAAALAAAFVALYALWDKDPSWGEAGLVASGTALIAAGLAAVGVKTVLTSSRGGPAQ